MKQAVLLAIVAIVAVNANISELQLAFGQKATQVDSTTATISCDDGYTSHGVASATYSYVGGTWSSTDNTYTEVLCTTSCSGSFEGDFGDCSSYSVSTGVNYNYCKEDKFDFSTTCSGSACTVHRFAYHQCTECGLCGTGVTTPTPPTTLPEQPSRDMGTSTAYGGCRVYDDSVLPCSSQGASEVASSRRCGYGTHSTSPAVYWDFCAKTGETACNDLIYTWTDSAGRTCRDYGQNACAARENKQSSDSPGFLDGDKFSDYETTSGSSVVKYDASLVCCMCGGGTKKCLEKDVPSSHKKPYMYDYRACQGVQVGGTCQVTCLDDGSTATTVDCHRPGIQAVVDTADFPASCPATHASWGLLTDTPSGTTGEDVSCSGTAVATASGTWKTCVQQASQNCYYALTWDYITNTCKFFEEAQCQGFTAVEYSYTFKRTESTPGYAPTLSNCITQSSTGTGGATETSVILSFNDANNCHSTGTWRVVANWQSADASKSGTQSENLVHGSEATSMSIAVDASKFASGQSHTFTMHAQFEDTSGTHDGPVSTGCSLVVNF